MWQAHVLANGWLFDSFQISLWITSSAGFHLTSPAPPATTPGPRILCWRGARVCHKNKNNNVIKNVKKRKEKKARFASGEECASISACSFPPDPAWPRPHLWSKGSKHVPLTHSEKPCECKPQYLCNSAYIWTSFCGLVCRGNTTY